LHIGICVTEIFGQGWGVVYPVKIFSSSWIIIQNLLAVFYSVGICRRCQKCGSIGTALLWDSEPAWRCWNAPPPHLSAYRIWSLWV